MTLRNTIIVYYPQHMKSGRKSPKSEDLPVLRIIFDHPADCYPTAQEPPCVVTGDVSEWHHLDEDDTNNDIANFLPLCRSLNSHLGQLKKKIDKHPESVHELPYQLAPHLEPSILGYKAAIHFSKGMSGRAYGCARLATFVAGSYLHQPFDDVILLALRSLRYVRHRYWPMLIEDVLMRDLRPHLLPRPSLSMQLRMFLLDEVCRLFLDAGETTAIIGRMDNLRAQIRDPRTIASDSTRARVHRLLAYCYWNVARHDDAQREIDCFDEIAKKLDLPSRITGIELETSTSLWEGNYSRALDETLQQIDLLGRVPGRSRQMQSPGAVPAAHERALHSIAAVAYIGKDGNANRIPKKACRHLDFVAHSLKASGGRLSARSSVFRDTPQFRLMLERVGKIMNETDPHRLLSDLPFSLRNAALELLNLVDECGS